MKQELLNQNPNQKMRRVFKSDKFQQTRGSSNRVASKNRDSVRIITETA